MPEETARARKRFPLWETLAIFVALASLWPAYIVTWPSRLSRLHLACKIFSYVMLAVMALVALRRMLAFRRFARQAEEEQRKAAESGKQERVRLPWEPPGSSP